MDRDSDGEFEKVSDETVDEIVSTLAEEIKKLINAVSG
jgi:hypothetical protein